MIVSGPPGPGTLDGKSVFIAQPHGRKEESPLGLGV